MRAGFYKYAAPSALENGLVTSAVIWLRRARRNGRPPLLHAKCRDEGGRERNPPFPFTSATFRMDGGPQLRYGYARIRNPIRHHRASDETISQKFRYTRIGSNCCSLHPDLRSICRSSLMGDHRPTEWHAERSYGNTAAQRQGTRGGRLNRRPWTLWPDFNDRYTF